MVATFLGGIVVSVNAQLDVAWRIRDADGRTLEDLTLEEGLHPNPGDSIHNYDVDAGWNAKGILDAERTYYMEVDV